MPWPLRLQPRINLTPDRTRTRTNRRETRPRRRRTFPPSSKSSHAAAAISPFSGKRTLKGATAANVKDGVLRLTLDQDVTIDLKEFPEILLQGSGNFIGKRIHAKRAVLVFQGAGKV